MKSDKPTAGSRKNTLTGTDKPEEKLEPDFFKIFKNSPVAAYCCDKNGYITLYNAAAAKLWERLPETGKDRWYGFWKIYYQDGRPMLPDETPLAKTLKLGIPIEDELITIETSNHIFRNLLVFSQPVFDEHTVLTGAYSTLVDVTAQQKGEINQAVLSAIVESSDDAIISKDMNGTIRSWNQGAQHIFGYTAEEAIGKSVTILIPKSRLNEEDLILENLKQGKKVDHIETVRIDKFGREVPISLTVSPIKDSNGNVIGASKVARDISDRVKGEAKHGVLSAIVESSDDAIISKNLDGIIMSWNEGARRIFGYTEEEAIGKSITMLVPESRLTEEMDILNRLKSGKRVDHFETIRINKQGREIPVSLAISPVKDKAGNVVGASKVARDISEQKNAEAQIKKHAKNLEILNSIGKSISEKLDAQVILQLVTDETTKITGAAFGAFFYNNINEQGESFMLFTLSGAPRSAFEKFGMPRNTDVFRPTFTGEGVVRVDDITKDPRYGHNHPHYGMPKGHPPVVSYLAVPVVSTSGAVIGGLFFGHPKAGVFKEEHEEVFTSIAVQAAIALDNSKLFEQVKSLSSKKDEFIALASHELKTPLTTIKGYLQLLARTERDKMGKLFLDKSLHQVNKLNSLVEDLLHMSKIESGKLEFNLEVFDIAQMLQDISETLGYSHQTHKIIYQAPDIQAFVEGDKQRIEQAIINLVTNAVKYSPGTDKVYITLEALGNDAIIKIKDEGIGLTPEQQNQLFTRFYRAEGTKGISGLGLGLYLTKQIIDRHKGSIKVSSTLGKGSEFSFSLPLKMINNPGTH